MKIIIKNPKEEPYVAEVEDNLETYQKIVGGYIEAIKIGDSQDRILLICNEEGKLKGLQPNFFISGDTIVGTVFFVGEGEEDFRGLTDDETDKILRWFSCEK